VDKGAFLATVCRIAVTFVLISPGCASSQLPETARIDFEEGVRLLKSKDPSHAAAAFERAEQTAPDNPQVQYMLGAAFQSSEQSRKAIDHYKRTIELRPAFTDLSLDIAHCYINLRQP